MGCERVGDSFSKRGRRLRWRGGVALVAALSMLVAAACGDDGDDDGDAAADTADGGETQDVEVVLGWLAEPSRGGLFAADQQGYYEEAGFDVTLEPGVDVSAIQLVASGRAEFGIGDAHELLTAREEGIPVVAVATTFQTNPRIVVYHSENPVESFEDIEGRTIFVNLGDDWWEFIKREYELDDVTEQAYPGQLTSFINDPNSLNQGYIGSEDVILEEEGIDVGSLLVADSGFNPYTNVMFTTEEFLAENEEMVRDFVDATIQGWEYYETDYETVNEYMQQFNEELSVEGMNQTAEAQEDLIYGADAEENGIGYMAEERWAELEQQMRELDILGEEIDVSTVFTTDYLPSS